jgi:UDPglucose 6-dehydrogenase
MKITMIGAGYVGLVSGTCFADFGHSVTCVDLDQRKIDALLSGIMPIYEPGLAELVASNVASGRLSFTTDLKAGVAGADAVFIAVGTPSRRGDGHADLTYVYQATRDIASAITGPLVVVTKSTVPVGTGDEVERILRDAAPDAEVAVVSNPEFLREGAAISDFKRPDRIVIGTTDARAKLVMQDIYRPLYLNQAPLLFTERLRRRSPSSTRWRICARPLAPMSRMWRAALASITALAPNSCTQVPAMVAPASRRIRLRC